MNLALVLNRACNLRCRYCYTGEKVDRPMPLAVARQAVDFGIAQARDGLLVLSMFGGEPLLEPALLAEVCAYAVERAGNAKVRLFFTASTNGTLLDARRVELLARYRFQVQLSLDGGDEAQDATRRFADGRSSFSEVSRGAAALRESGLLTRILAVIDPANAHLLAESFEHLAALGGGAPHLYFSPNYLGEWTDEACERFEHSLRELGDALVERYRRAEEIRLDPLHGKIAAHLLRGQKLASCGFGADEMAVSPSGRLYPCDRMVRQDDDPAMCLGSVQEGIDPARRDALLKLKRAVDPECESCELRARCSRGCGCAQVETSGGLGRVSPVFCWFERSFIAEADRVAGVLYSEKNPAFLRRFYAAAAQARS